MVNPGIHELLQESINNLIGIGSSMAQAPARTKAARFQRQQWFFALQDYINATDRIIDLRRQDEEAAP